MSTSALAGMRVIDCTHVIAGAYCSMLLADLGADDIKIEPIGGETGRGSVDPDFQPWDFINRNKRAIALDLQSEQGVEIVRRLAESADVFVENFRPGVLDRLGLGYEALREINPGLVYCSISGFGHSGPYRDRGGFDLVAQGMSGIMSFTGEIGGQDPVAAGVPLSDLNAGCFGALGILAAVNHRRDTGVGQKVEATLLESALGYAVWETGLYLTTGEIAVPRGSRHRLAAPYEALKARNGHLVVGVNSQRLWERFCRAIGGDEIAANPAYSSPTDRIANREALKADIEAILATRDVAHWLGELEREGVPSGPINTIAEAIADPQIEARGLINVVDGMVFTRAPVSMSETPVKLRTGPAKVGAHTRDVLTEAGYAPAEIDALAADGRIELAKG